MHTSTQASSPKEVIVISHSPIFYWWPVWFVGFLMAAWTYLDGHLMAVVPAGTVAEGSRTVGGHDVPRDVLVLRRARGCRRTGRPGPRSSRVCGWPPATAPG